MKLYIHTDMEGVAGMVHFEDRQDDTTEGYFRRRRLHKLLTGEVNAAIEGAVAMGVAADEDKRQGLNPHKRQRLINAGADLVVTNFLHHSILTDYLTQVAI